MTNVYQLSPPVAHVVSKLPSGLLAVDRVTGLKRQRIGTYPSVAALAPRIAEWTEQGVDVRWKKGHCPWGQEEDANGAA